MRRRLANLGWFMKSLKEPLARIANKKEGVSGAFWEGRFKSVAVADEESLLATAAYIDLNPLAAGVAATPEESKHTSLATRIDHCRANATVETLRDDLSVLTRNPAQEADLWLLPVDDDRSHGGERPGLHEGLTLSCYLRLVDASSRMIRAGKTSLEAEMRQSSRDWAWINTHSNRQLRNFSVLASESRIGWIAVLSPLTPAGIARSRTDTAHRISHHGMSPFKRQATCTSQCVDDQLSRLSRPNSSSAH